MDCKDPGAATLYVAYAFITFLDPLIDFTSLYVQVIVRLDDFELIFFPTEYEQFRFILLFIFLVPGWKKGL